MLLALFHARGNPALFHTGWFVESLFTQSLIIHIIRTSKLPFLQSRASWPLLAGMLLTHAAHPAGEALVLSALWGMSESGPPEDRASHLQEAPSVSRCVLSAAGGSYR
jgi:hypothetical protein